MGSVGPEAPEPREDTDIPSGNFPFFLTFLFRIG
jgi:hypothetical protein